MDIALTSPQPASFDVLAPERCMELLAVATVGRVAFVGTRGLQVLPVSYRMIDGVVILKTSAAGTLAELADHHGEVVFEADHPSSLTRHGWSVVVRATSSVVSDEATLTSRELAALVPWSSGDHPLVLALEPHLVTGRTVG